MTLVCFHMASKASQFLPIVLYISSIHSYMLYIVNNIHDWLHVCMQFQSFSAILCLFVNYSELWVFVALLDLVVFQLSHYLEININSIIFYKSKQTKINHPFNCRSKEKWVIPLIIKAEKSWKIRKLTWTLTHHEMKLFIP